MPSPKKKSPNPSDSESLKRKMEILRRVDAGESVNSIAPDIGVSRTYIYVLLQKRREEGEAAVLTIGRGKRKDVPLTQTQHRELVKAVRNTQPWEHGIAAGLWSEGEIKEWLLKNYQRTIAIGQIRQLAMKARLQMRPLSQEEWKHIPVIPLDGVDTPEGDRLESDELGSFDENAPNAIEIPEAEQWDMGENLSVEEMRASVEETRKLMAKKGVSYRGPSVGVRTGKHRKQRAPQQKKKTRNKKR